MEVGLLFPPRLWFSEPWEIRFLAGATTIILTLAIALFRLNKLRPTDIYDPQRAWLRAAIYFFLCFLVSWSAGVLPTLRSIPIARPDQLGDPLWWTATLGLTAIIAFGYGVVWRRGTVAYSRPLTVTPLLIFGVAWGFATGELLLSIWSLIEKLGFGPLVSAMGTFLIGGSLNGLWHSKYWDSHVSPDHNVLECNRTKILLAHFPNLIFSLMHLALFSNPYVFVLGQVLALTISTLVMRFPPFWGPASVMISQHPPEGRPRAKIDAMITQTP